MEAHWAVQVIGWRLAVTDAQGTWSMEDGVAASPAAASDIRNVSLYANDMLGVRTERVALVGHLLND